MVGPVPSVVSRASIVLCNTAAFAATGRAPGMAEKVADTMRHLDFLASRCFGGANGFGLVAQPMEAGVVLWLSGAPLPPALIVMATRILVGLHDADPSGLDRLEAALDGEREQALALWGGVVFDSAVARVEITCEGDGSVAAFDPIWIDTTTDPLVNAERLDFLRLAPTMPDGDLEDAILLASGFNAFWPLGSVPEYSLGD